MCETGKNGERERRERMGAGARERADMKEDKSSTMKSGSLGGSW